MERSSVCSVASERYEGIMKKFFLLSVILYAFLSCKKGEGNQEVEFINNDFKVVLDSFILDAKIYSIQQYNDILISLDEENNDTILSFENANPFELENLKKLINLKNSIRSNVNVKSVIFNFFDILQSS